MRYTLDELQNKFEYNPITGDVYILDYGRWKKKVIAKTVSSDGYYRSNIMIRENETIPILIHRVAYELYNNIILGTEVIDHKDQNKLNNKYDNLRAVTRAINNKNLGLKKTNKLGSNNIEQLPSGKYRARITVNGKKIALGTFVYLEDAINAKQEANIKYDFYINHK